jgi:hypothetical protein
MKPGSALTALIILVAAAPRAAAQIATQVTIRVPVVLTQLAPEIQSVKVTCSIVSDALITGDATYPNTVSKDEDIPVSDGTVAKVVTMVFSLTLKAQAGGQAAGAGCTIRGWDVATSSWTNFHESASNPRFRTTPSASPSQSTFVW